MSSPVPTEANLPFRAVPNPTTLSKVAREGPPFKQAVWTNILAGSPRTRRPLLRLGSSYRQVESVDGPPRNRTAWQPVCSCLRKKRLESWAVTLAGSLRAW